MPIILILILIFFILTTYFVLKKLLSKPSKLNLPDFGQDHKYQVISKSQVLQKKEEAKSPHHLELEGEILVSRKIHSIYLIHGTFVGDDPLQLLAFLKNCWPNIPDKILTSLKKNNRLTGEFFSNDLGNFTKKHIEILKSITKQKINISNFTWSSANNHYARLEGAIKLANELAIKHKPENRVMLIAHSHAGSVIAILTQLINDEQFKLQILKLMIKNEVLIDNLEESLNILKKINFEIITLGCPARYEWNLTPNMKLIHLINSRFSNTKNYFQGSLCTKEGDYVQQWGINGSDFIVPSKKIQQMNQELDEFFGTGVNLEILHQNVIKKNRFHNTGFHYLIDYDDSSVLPNCLKTVFGHGVYTKIEHLNFLLSLINKTS